MCFEINFYTFYKSSDFRHAHKNAARLPLITLFVTYFLVLIRFDLIKGAGGAWGVFWKGKRAEHKFNTWQI